MASGVERRRMTREKVCRRDEGYVFEAFLVA